MIRLVSRSRHGILDWSRGRCGYLVSCEDSSDNGAMELSESLCLYLDSCRRLKHLLPLARVSSVIRCYGGYFAYKTLKICINIRYIFVGQTKEYVFYCKMKRNGSKNKKASSQICLMQTAW